MHKRRLEQELILFLEGYAYIYQIDINFFCFEYQILGQIIR